MTWLPNQLHQEPHSLEEADNRTQHLWHSASEQRIALHRVQLSFAQIKKSSLEFPNFVRTSYASWVIQHCRRSFLANVIELHLLHLMTLRLISIYRSIQNILSIRRDPLLTALSYFTFSWSICWAVTQDLVDELIRVFRAYHIKSPHRVSCSVAQHRT